MAPTIWPTGSTWPSRVAGGALDLVTVAVGLPFAATFYFLRVEAFFGGRGDRFVAPGMGDGSAHCRRGVRAGRVFAGTETLQDGLRFHWAMAPQLLLVAST